MYTTKSDISVIMTERQTHDLCTLALTKNEFGYQIDIRALEMDEIDPIEGGISLVGTRIGGLFEHTSELKAMKYDG